jgi:putative ABC transport system permease protein
LRGSFSGVVAIAGREMRGGIRGFGIFLACLALGVAAIAAVGVVNAGVTDAVQRNGRVLLGGDARIENVNLPIPQAELDAVIPPEARLARVVTTTTIVRAGDRRVVASLKAVDGAYPLYGSVVLRPSLPLEKALADDGAVAEPGLLARLGLAVGDSVRLGNLDVRITAVLESEPDRLGGFVTIGPRLLVGMQTLETSGILGAGSLARYAYRLALPPGSDAAALVARITREHPDASWQARSSADVQPQIARFTDRLATYLTLAGLTALLIGGLGVGLAVDGYLASKRATIATLECLGATGRQIFAAYLLQIMALAGIGVAIGLVAGQTLPLLVRLLPSSMMPVAVDYGIYPLPLLLAGGAGLAAALLFALWPLAMARETSPAGLFRALVAPPRAWPRPPYLAIMAGLLCALALLAILSVARPEIGAVFVGVAVVSALLLALLSRGILRLVRALGERGPVSLRLAARNLQRPGSGASSVVVALGAGLGVLTAVAVLQANLAGEIEVQIPKRVPTAFFIDIQPDEVEAFRSAVAATPGASILQSAPMLRARVVRIAGQPVASVPIDPHVAWTVRNDRGLTYAAAMPEGTELAAGRWWPADYSGPPLVSVEDEVAKGYHVGVGDTLSFNILGRVIEARIANLRRDIDWSSGRLNFVFILSPGVLEAAPHTVVAAVDVPPDAEAGLYDRLATGLPNVTPIAVGAIIRQVADVFRKIAAAVDVVAGITLATGILVLAGAVSSARRRQLFQTVVLKVLGARRADSLRLLLIEYLTLGLAAAVVGGALGTAGAWILVRHVLGLPWLLPWPTILAIVVLGLAVTLGVAAAGIWRVLGFSAAQVLRAP